MKPYRLIMLIVALQISSPVCPSGAESGYRRTTVAAILKAGSRIDGKRVELEGSILFGVETDMLQDSSVCVGAGRKACSLWLQYGDCVVAYNPDPHNVCGAEIARHYEHYEKGKPSGLSIVLSVTVRGVISTVRKDVKYDRSVPKPARRGGFGHLGAYLAELSVEEIILPKVLPANLQ